MLIKTKLTEKEYIQANLNGRPLLGISVVVFRVFLISAAVLQIILIFSKANIVLAAGLFLSSFSPFLIAIIMFSIVQANAKKSYASNKLLGETIEYNFDDEWVVIKGETFSIQMPYSDIFKITHSKKWVFILKAPLSPKVPIDYIIAKNDMPVGDIAKLKLVFASHHVKNTL